MSNKPKILSNTVKGIGKLAGETVKEATKQAGKTAEDAAGELIGSSKSSDDKTKGDNSLQQLKEMNKDKSDKEIAELMESIKEDKPDKPKVSPKKSPQVGGRDVDKEIQDVRNKKEKKEKEEEQLLEEMKKQREAEKQQAEKEAQIAGNGPLNQTGSKKKRGTALIQQRGKSREIKGGKN